MDSERPQLRTVGTSPSQAASPNETRLGEGAPPINELAELVADLIAATGLVPQDKLALVRGAVGQGSLAQALVDLAVAGVAENASKEIPLHVLERVVAIPYALDGDTIRVALADPGNIQAIDE